MKDKDQTDQEYFAENDWDSRPTLMAKSESMIFSVFPSYNGQELQCALFMRGKIIDDIGKSSFTPKEYEDGQKYFEAIGFLNPDQVANRFIARLEAFENKILHLTLRCGNEHYTTLPLKYSNAVYPNKAMLDTHFETSMVKLIRDYLGIDISMLKENKITTDYMEMMPNEEVEIHNAEDDQQRHQHEGRLDADSF